MGHDGFHASVIRGNKRRSNLTDALLFTNIQYKNP